MSKSLHNLSPTLDSPNSKLKSRHLSLTWEIFPECIDCLIKRHVVSFSPTLFLISWAYLFVCKSHTANAKDLFAVGKTISVTHLSSGSLAFALCSKTLAFSLHFLAEMCSKNALREFYSCTVELLKGQKHTQFFTPIVKYYAYTVAYGPVLMLWETK